MTDRKAAVKLLGGTIARGLLWAAAALSAWLGSDKLGEDTAEGLGYFLASAAVAGVSLWWSKRNERQRKDEGRREILAYVRSLRQDGDGQAADGPEDVA